MAPLTITLNFAVSIFSKPQQDSTAVFVRVLLSLRVLAANVFFAQVSPIVFRQHCFSPALFLTFFHADFRKEFPSRTLCGEVHPETAPFQALCCAPCSTEQSTFRRGKEGQKGAEKRRGRGVASKGGKRKRERLKQVRFQG